MAPWTHIISIATTTEAKEVIHSKSLSNLTDLSTSELTTSILSSNKDDEE